MNNPTAETAGYQRIRYLFCCHVIPACRESRSESPRRVASTFRKILDASLRWESLRLDKPEWQN